MLGIGLVLLVEAATGSYATAGAVAGVFGVTSALASPWVSRAVDRFGQARVMLPAIALHVTGLILVLSCTQLDTPRWTIFAAAVIAGASIGSIGSLVRARWSFALTGHQRAATLLHTAYSLESVIDEVVFVSGPLLVTLLATQFAPALGIIASALAVGIGGTALMLQRGSEPPPSGLQHGPGAGVLRAPGMVVLSLAMVCVGVIFGSMDVIAIAFADERHHLNRAGWVLAAFALGSLVAGLGYGSVQWTWPAGRRFRLGVVLLAVGVVPVLFVQNLAQMAVVVFIAGFAISPMLISGNALVQELVDPTRLTEGLTWIGSGIGIGVSAGAAIAGAVVDAAGAQGSFSVPVTAGLLAAVLVLTCSRWLRPVRSPQPAA
jgi:MFS family permease